MKRDWSRIASVGCRSGSDSAICAEPLLDGMSTTSTVFVPDCFWTIRLTALSPSAARRQAARLLERVLDPADVLDPHGLAVAVGDDQLAKSRGLLDPAHRAQHQLLRAWSTRPPGCSWFSRISAWRTSSIVRF